MAGGDSSVAVLAKEWSTDEQIWEDPADDPVDPRFSEYDPKRGDFINTRFFFRSDFDLDEESPAGPMRHTDKIFREGFRLKNTVNVVSVKIVSSDYGYPLSVYGTIIARDSLDRKCVYIFRRDQDNSQFITSKEDSLILTGPKRGFMVCDDIFFEIDLKVKDAHGRKFSDERLSKGLMEVDAIRRLAFEPIYEVETEKLVSMHSILDLNYTFIRKSVEGTVEIRILQGPVDFHGKVIACTTRTPCDIVLHDSKVSGMLTADDDGVVQLARRVVGVSEDEMLLLTVAVAGAGAGDELTVCTVDFTPRRNSYVEEQITCGDYKLLLKVTWSIVHF